MRINKKLIIALGLVGMMCFLAACGGAKIPKSYSYDDLSKYIKLGKYEGLTYEKQSTKVTDSEVEKKIKSNLEAAAEDKEVKSGVITDDSVVNIDYVGSVNGKEFDGGKAEGQTIDIANSGYIPGFAEALVGHEVGTTFDINVTFPEDYGNEELAGKDAVFKITVNSMTEKDVPKFDDKFVKANSDFKTTAEYKADVRKQLEESKKQQADSAAEEELFRKIVEDSTVIEYPSKETDELKTDMIDNYKDMAESNGLSYEDFLQSQFGTTEKEFEDDYVTPAVENSVKQELVVRALADKLDLKFTDKEYDEFLKELLESAGLTEDQFKETYGTTIDKYAEKNNLYSSMLYEKVMEKVLELSKAK